MKAEGRPKPARHLIEEEQLADETSRTDRQSTDAEPVDWVAQLLNGDLKPQPPTRKIAVGLTVDLETTQPSFDLDHCVKFLDAVFGDVYSGRLGLSYLAGGRMRSQDFQWLRNGAARAAEWDTHRRPAPTGIYFRCTFLPPEGVKSGRGSADDAHCLPFLWADLDYGTVGHKPDPKGLPLPPDEEAARKIIAALPMHPSLIIHSGGGLYPIWQFARPIYLDQTNRDEAAARSQQWQEVIQSKAAELGWHYGSGVGDLARVLRLPGSVNRKLPGRPRPCRVIEQTGEVFPW